MSTNKILEKINESIVTINHNSDRTASAMEKVADKISGIHTKLETMGNNVWKLIFALVAIIAGVIGVTRLS